MVRVHHDLAFDISCGSTNHLDERGFATQETLLVRVKNRNERHFGKIESLSQQVDADEHVELSKAQVTKDLDAFERVDFGVEIPHPKTELEQIVGQVLRHLLRERRHQDSLVELDALPDELDKVVDLPLRRLHDDLRVDQAGRAHDLFHHVFRDIKLVVTRGRRQEDDLIRHLQPFIESQGTVVGRRGQPEPVLDQHVLAATVARVLPVKLRNSDMGLIEHHQVIVGEIVEQRVGTIPRLTPIDMH